MAWKRFAGATVVGDVRVRRGVEGRDLFAYLPPSHGNGRRFPVLYMHDGQNLFDEETSTNGEWRVDESMEALAREGLEAILVGVNVDETRREQYAGAGADAYLRLLVETVRPIVEEAFDADPRREVTGVAGSSLGGVHALYAHRDVFGFAGVFSCGRGSARTACWLCPTAAACTTRPRGRAGYRMRCASCSRASGRSATRRAAAPRSARPPRPRR